MPWSDRSPGWCPFRRHLHFQRENFNGEVSFDYTVNDGLATSAAQTFTIAVEGVNEPPVPAAEGNSNSTREDTVLNGSVPAGSDADGDDLT